MTNDSKHREHSLRTLAILLLVPWLAAVTDARAGTIRGRVTLVGSRTNADAVVYVDAIPGKTFPAPKRHAEMDQIRLEFTPHVLPIQVGTTVEFHNSDSVSHNVFTVDECADAFDLGSWTRGETRSYTFTRDCKAVILCNIHPEMEAWIVAVPTPYFAITDRDGSYEIQNVPDGSHTVKVWHPDLEEATAEVTVAGEAELNMTLK